MTSRHTHRKQLQRLELINQSIRSQRLIKSVIRNKEPVIVIKALALTSGSHPSATNTQHELPSQQYRNRLTTDNSRQKNWSKNTLDPKNPSQSSSLQNCIAMEKQLPLNSRSQLQIPLLAGMRIDILAQLKRRLNGLPMALAEESTNKDNLIQQR